MSIPIGAQQLRAMEGTDLASDIDQGFQDLALDVSDIYSSATYMNCAGVDDPLSFLASSGGPGLVTYLNPGLAWIREPTALASPAEIPNGIVNPLVPFLMPADEQLSHSTAHATLPRIDIIVLQLLEDETIAEPQVIAGTATVGATLANRNGAAAVPSGSLLVADVLIGAAATSLTDDKYADRRLFRNVAENYLATDRSALLAHPSCFGTARMVVNGSVYADSGASTAVGILTRLDHRQVVEYIEWTYLQGSTATVGNYAFNLYDMRGYLEASFETGSFTGGAGLIADGLHAVIDGPITLEPGYKILTFETDSISAGSGAVAPCYVMEPAAGTVPTPGLVLDFNSINTFGTALESLSGYVDFFDTFSLSTGVPMVQLIGEYA